MLLALGRRPGMGKAVAFAHAMALEGRPQPFPGRITLMKIRPPCYALACSGLLAAAVFVPHGVHAEAKKKAAAVAGPQVNVPALTARLKSTDPAELQSALGEAAAAGRGAAPLAPVIEDLLNHGASAALDTVLLQTLGSLGVEKSSVAIRPYARHRNVDLRRAAIKALLKTGGKEAVLALREGLSDADAIVRGTAASGLGALRAHEAMGDLFLAL